MDKIEDGSVLENDHGYPVGNCYECKLIQNKMYALDEKWYCISCLPKVVNLKMALIRLREEYGKSP